MKEKKLSFTDYIVIIIKWKKIIIPTLLISMLVSYLYIYFFIEEKFEATALVIPSEDQEFGALGGLLSNLQGLPLDIGQGITNTEMDMYNAIIYSRTTLDDIIKKFNLPFIYDYDTTDKEYFEDLMEQLEDDISTKVVEVVAFSISVTSITPELAAEMTNYLVNILNKRIVDLKISKSAENRRFLEERVMNIRQNLADAENSLKKFQKSSGMLNAEEQLKGIISVYADLEKELIQKQVEKSSLVKILENSPEVENVKIAVEEFERKIEEIKLSGTTDGMLLPLNTIPDATIEYFRLFREVEIQQLILEFILPLYEQAKFQEHKDVPILQIIDYAVPPVKKSYPPRMIFTLLIGFSIFIFLFFIILINENQEFNKSSNLHYIKNNIFKWNVKEE